MTGSADSSVCKMWTDSNMFFQQGVFSAERIGDLRIRQVMSLAEQCAGPLMRGWEGVEAALRGGERGVLELVSHALPAGTTAGAVLQRMQACPAEPNLAGHRRS